MYSICIYSDCIKHNAYVYALRLVEINLIWIDFSPTIAVRNFEDNAENSQPELDGLSAYTIDDAWNEYEGEIVVKGKIQPTNSKIMKEIASKMGRKPKAVYITMKRRYEKTYPNAKLDGDGRETPLSDATTVEDASQNSNDEGTNKESSSGKFDTDDASIFEIVSRKRKHRKTEIETLAVKPGWTSKLALFLWEEAKLSCKFDLKVANVTSKREIKVKASCECGSVLNISSQSNNMIVTVDNIDTEYEHKPRYQVTGEIKKHVVEALKHNSALKVQTMRVNELIPNNTTLETNFSPVIPTLNTNRTIKCLENRSNEEPMETLLKWKETIYKGVISLISYSPFTIHYQTKLQAAWYTVFSRKGRMSVSIDATGSVVKPLQKSQKIDGSDKLKHVFLYSIYAKTNSKSVPIGQMVTQDQTFENIEFFMRKMFKHPMRAPREFVMDESKAQLKAVSIYIGYDGIEEYIEECMATLLTDATPPKSQIRYDRSHFCRNVARKIRHRDHRRQNFYRCVIGYLLKCGDFNIVKKILYDFFTVIFNEYDGHNVFNEALPSETSKIRLVNLIGTHNEDFDYADDSEESSEICDIIVNTDWINNIIETVPIETNGEHLNVFYNKSDSKMYVKLFSTVALWSNVMNASFGSTADVATSSDVESSFKSLKNGILEGKMWPAHLFLRAHVDFVNAGVKLNAMGSNNGSTEPSKRKRSNSFVDLRSKISAPEMRKRSNSNQYEFNGSSESDSEIGKNETYSSIAFIHTLTVFQYFIFISSDILKLNAF